MKSFSIYFWGIFFEKNMRNFFLKNYIYDIFDILNKSLFLDMKYLYSYFENIKVWKYTLYEIFFVIALQIFKKIF